jgi:hypothetical protein
MMLREPSCRVLVPDEARGAVSIALLPAAARLNWRGVRAEPPVTLETGRGRGAAGRARTSVVDKVTRAPVVSLMDPSRPDMDESEGIAAVAGPELMATKMTAALTTPRANGLRRDPGITGNRGMCGPGLGISLTPRSRETS